MIIDTNLDRWKHSSVSVVKLKLCSIFFWRRQRYEEARYILLIRLREQLGIQAPSVYTLLGYDGHVELPNWRDLTCEEIGQYIERIERFEETQDKKLASQ